jgi:hypothetical protein
VSWRFRTDNTEGKSLIRWSAFFDRGSPFGASIIDISTLSSRIVGQHIAVTANMLADTPGDYKYGVKAEDPITGKELGEDDPKLKVVTD